jgi:signal transduction histidine kinase
LAGQFSSPEILCLPAGAVQRIGQASGLAWAVSLWNERGLGGLLLLGEKVDCNPFTQEEMEIAQAGGERLLDMLAGVEMARLSMDLLRQRLSQQRVLEGRSRRVLHDEVLPELHTAILYLSGQQDTPEVRQAVETLAKAHRSISDLMRDSLPNAPQRLEQGGLAAALQAVLDGDLAGEFSTVKWQVDAGANEAVGRYPLFVSEVVYFAGRELLRNAARYGRGGDSARPLHLMITLEQNDGLRLVVEDDGVGLSAGGQAGRRQLEVGTGSGLRFHSAMLAAVGASLEVGSRPGCGTRGVIVFPEEKA